MLLDYLKKIRARGQRSFTLEEAMVELKMPRKNILASIGRLKKQSTLISPAKGFYVIVPPEYQQIGCIPAEELIPLVMGHLGLNYYAGLLTAALYHGASHQKPAWFQIITNKRFGRKLKFGKVNIIFIYKKFMQNLPIQNITVSTGYLKISSPELTAIDLLKYPNKSGGLNHIATVLSELIESIDSEKLISLANQLHENICLQRMGYILEKIDPVDTESNEKIIKALAEYLASEKLRYMPLAPEIPTVGYPYSKKWMIIENSSVESDI